MGYGFEQAATLFSSGITGSFILSLGIIGHYSSMSRGVIDTRDVVYFMALIIIFLLMTHFRLKTEKK
jgi:ABC-2 type transport system permease protein